MAGSTRPKTFPKLVGSTTQSLTNMSNFKETKAEVKKYIREESSLPDRIVEFLIELGIVRTSKVEKDIQVEFQLELLSEEGQKMVEGYFHNRSKM